MEVRMKYRIVGILVIIALAVIVVPMFFSRSGINTNEPKLSQKIPNPPAKPQTELQLPQEPKTVDLTQQQTLTSPGQTQQQSPVITTKPVIHTVKKPTHPVLAKVKAFSIQLGTFADSQNAKTLVKKLRHAGFTAYSKQITHDQKSLTRVLIGPVVKRKQAEKILKELQAKFNLKGIVVDYKV